MRVLIGGLAVAASFVAVPVPAQMAPAHTATTRVLTQDRVAVEARRVTPMPAPCPAHVASAPGFAPQSTALNKQIADLQESLGTQRKYIALLEGEVARLQGPAKP